MSDSQQRSDNIKKLAELIHDIPVAMLTTIRPSGGLHSRPMANVNREFDGDLWFLTQPDDLKSDEIRAEPSVNVSLAVPSQNQFVSLAGEAHVEEDNKRAELLWNESVATWFPPGTKPSDLSLIRVDVKSAEFWDANASTMVALSEVVHQVVSGDPSRPVVNETVEWKE